MGSILRRFQGLVLGLGIFTGFGTILMTLAVVTDVACRVLFNAPLAGASEFSELLLVAMIFLGLAAAQQRREHFAIDLVTQYLPPAVKRAVLLAGWLASLAVVALLAWLSAKSAWMSFLRSEASYGTTAFPVWPGRAVLAFGLALLAVQLAVDIALGLRPARPADAGPHTSRHE
ncbi:hypothetical protein STVA_38460 [Allostella vacuolata]|nr:hypothetical protein STVA_38460 [Stella vacuolata]